MTTGCGPSLPEVDYESEHARVGVSDPELALCAGNLADIDAEIERIDATYELEVPRKSSLWIVEDELYEDFCPESSSGCVVREGAFVREHKTGGIWHELVHDRTGWTEGGSLNFGHTIFTEGLAVALGRARCEPKVAWDLPDAQTMLEGGSTGALKDIPHGYFTAGQLVRWLLLTHGVQALKDFIYSIDWRMSPDEVRAHYSAAFGTSIDDDVRDHISWGAEGHHRFELGCRGAELEPEPDSLRPSYALQATLDCSAADVRSNFERDENDASEGRVEWVLHVDGEQGEVYGFELVGDVPEGTTLEIEACDCKGSFLSQWLPSLPLSLRGLEPGDYRLVWTGPLDAGHELDVSLVGDCDMALQDCPAGEQCFYGSCEPEVSDPAGSGEPCTQLDDGPLACDAGLYCLGVETGVGTEGWCAALCELDEDCPQGQQCGGFGVCGDPCDVYAQDCDAGYACTPRADQQGTCIPHGGGGLLDACIANSCGPGFSCEWDDELDGCDGWLGGCCVPICALEEPACPEALPSCEDLGGYGVCKP
ncbi:hypothetical protein G6O69_10775 [Pseudenhygromyxa sp. WMMC2535]|uniref:hypothetical protein n=1 Tax=Pseudenhygromyxa sp. WMMC2535 TaxID=2712867 RepID=UPI001552F76B|nr:hypothetical protein [Pseudenhygromyxa sp. WMMC2535]NVB38316.1 hypothetical protein [Pseudenhygromyxa sp. WMMC2535]